MNELETVGKSKDHEAMKQEGMQNLLHLSNFVISLQNQSNNHEKRIAGLEDNMRINGVQEMNIKEKGNIAVLRALDGKESNAYKDRRVRGKTYSEMWRRFKKRFGIPRYGELPAKDYDSAIEFLENWQPDKELEVEIEQLNNQLDLLDE